jgi:hypothetical protein
MLINSSTEEASRRAVDGEIVIVVARENHGRVRAVCVIAARNGSHSHRPVAKTKFGCVAT